MALSALRQWLGRSFLTPADAPEAMQFDEPDLALAFPTPLREAPTISISQPLPWTAERLRTTDALWGDGFQFPGGEIETLRLATPLGLSKACSLLLIGAGAGGPACALAVRLGVWVSGFEADPDLVAAALDRIQRRNLSKRAQMEPWTPEAPNLREHFYHHGLALEPLHGAQPEGTLTAIARALKPGGQFMMVELVAKSRLNPKDPLVATWARLERRDPAAVPRRSEITRTLGRLRFDVRVAEDISDRHTHQAIMGWRTLVRNMENTRPNRREAMHCVREAELWLLRLRLFQTGVLGLVRWHAIGAG